MNRLGFCRRSKLGLLLIGILAGAFSGATIAEEFAARLVEKGMAPDFAEPLAIGLVVIVLTFLTLVVGELVPKRVALLHADAIAVHVAPIIKWVARLTHPFVTLLQISTEGVLRVFGIRSNGSTAVTDEEINALVAEGAHQGAIDPAERQMVAEVLRLADRPVRTIMTHRRDLVWLDVTDSSKDVRTKIADTGYSRFLVCDGGLDNCLGYVRTRAIVDRLLDEAPLDLASLVREPLRVSPELKTLELVGRFRRARPHVALVIDEYGTTLGACYARRRSRNDCRRPCR